MKRRPPFVLRRSLYGRLKRKLPKGSRLNVKQRVERRIAEYSAQMLPDFAASIGVEAAAGDGVVNYIHGAQSPPKNNDVG